MHCKHSKTLRTSAATRAGTVNTQNPQIVLSRLSNPSRNPQWNPAPAGPLRIPMYVKIMGRDVPFPLVVRCPFRGEEGGRRRLRHWGFGWGLFRFTVTTHCSSYRAAATPSPPPPPPPPPFRHHHPSHEYTRCFNGF